MSAAIDTDMPDLPQPGSDGARGGAPAGPRKAAILLMMLGADIAREMLRELDDGEVQLILTTAMDVKTVAPEEAAAVLEEYVGYFEQQTLLAPRPGEFVRAVAEEAFGPARVRSLLGIVEEEPKPTGLLAETKGAGPDAIAGVLEKEHPQTVAIALSAMEPGKASRVLGELSEELRAEVVRRIAQLRSVTPELLQEIGDTLRRELETSIGASISLDGQELAVKMLKALAPEDEESVFERLAEADPELSEEIRKKMFVFEDLVTLDGRALQVLLKEVDGQTLTLALKTASSALREHILSSMSSRAATMILEDLEAMGPVAVSQVEQSQDDIVQVALRLAAEGKLNLR